MKSILEDAAKLPTMDDEEQKNIQSQIVQDFRGWRYSKVDRRIHRVNKMKISKMVDEYRLLRDALNTIRYVQSIKRLNQVLYDSPCGSTVISIKIYWKE